MHDCWCKGYDKKIESRSMKQKSILGLYGIFIPLFIYYIQPSLVNIYK